MPTRHGSRWQCENGHSLFSSLFGVVMFLIMLLFAVQITTHLHATTVVTTAAFDAARLVSGAQSIHAGDAATFTECRLPSEDELDAADAHLGGLLGALWEQGGTSDWTGSTLDEVRVTVSVQTPAKVIGGVGVVAGLDRIERTISLARECVR